MKVAIIVFLLIVIGALLTIIYLLFQPNAKYQASAPSLLSKQAALGRAVIDAAQRDPAVAAVARASVQAASREDRALASDLLAEFPDR